MIGLSGILAPLKNDKNIATMAGQLVPKWGTSTRYKFDNAVVNIFDSNQDAGNYQKDNVTVLVAGDIYEDCVIAGPLSKARFLYERFAKDPQSVASANGSYLFLIIDDNQQRFLLGSDNNSFIPLYYFFDKSSKMFFFSWDIKTFFDSKLVDPTLNEKNAFNWLLMGGRGFKDETRFENINRLEPGHTIELSAKGLERHQSRPFHFARSSDTEENLLQAAVDTLKKALERRTHSLNSIAIGLSGGLDSRILLAAGAKIHTGDWVSYCYGAKSSNERNIARQVANLYKIPFHSVTFHDHMYLDYAKDGVFYSGGESLFKHGIQTHFFNTLKEKFNTQGNMLGSALDLVLGATFSNDAIYSLKGRDDLYQYYRGHMFNMERKTFVDLFRSEQKGAELFDSALVELDECLSLIPGDCPSDINDAFAFDVRIKRWYNHNLIYCLLSNKILIPTYDTDFLNIVSKVPFELRRDSNFRVKLLSRLDPDAAALVHDTTMIPAGIAPSHSKRFAECQRQIDELKMQVWFDSNRSIYIPSDRYDANFMEWFRVYPAYIDYLHDHLTGKESMLCESYFEPSKIRKIIEDHVEGRKDNHKILVMLLSMELTMRVFLRHETGSNPEFIDFSQYFDRT